MIQTSMDRAGKALVAGVALAVLAGAAAAAAASTPARAAGGAAAKPLAPLHSRAIGAAARDSSLTLKGGEEGTVFRSLTVEGEDRIHVTIERPPLAFDVDPATAPGLKGTSAREVLDRTRPDALAPIVAASARESSPYEGRPWLDRFASDGVARFHSAVKGATSWKLTVADAGGRSVMAWEGSGDPPAEIVWDGRTADGAPVTPGFTYSYVLEARDRAGNRRNFVGQGFHVDAYRYGGVEHPLLVFAGRALGGPESMGPSLAGAAPLILLEAASWLNRSRKAGDLVRVTATARTPEQARALAERVAHALAPRLAGDPAGIQAVAETKPGAPEDGAVRIELTQ